MPIEHPSFLGLTLLAQAAEELRDALGEVLAKATRLIAILKATRKEKKVLASVWAGLKQLNLAPRNGGPT